MYDLLFEVGPIPRNLVWTIVFGIAPFVVVGLAVLRDPARLANDGLLATRGGRLFLVGFPCGILFLLTFSMFSERARLRTALRNQTYEVVEGVVAGYTPLGPTQRPPESWTVSGRRYEISPFTITMGFNRPGVVREGMRVRIADVQGMIARLEVASPPSAGEAVAGPAAPDR